MLNCTELKTDLSITTHSIKQALPELNIIKALISKNSIFFIVEKKFDQMQAVVAP